MIAAAAIAAGLALATLTRPRRCASARLTATVGPRPHDVSSRGPRALVATSVLGIAAVAAAAAWQLLAAALVVAVLVRLRSRAQPRSDTDDALLADLLGGCLGAGAPPPAALRAAGSALGGDAQRRCLAVADALARGEPPAWAWASWLADPALAPIARPCARSTTTGSAAAAELTRVAARLRERRRADTTRRVQRAAVWVVLPLGVCFLPAFVLVGVVPLVIGLLPALR